MFVRRKSHLWTLAPQKCVKLFIFNCLVKGIVILKQRRTNWSRALTNAQFNWPMPKLHLHHQAVINLCRAGVEVPNGISRKMADGTPLCQLFPEMARHSHVCCPVDKMALLGDARKLGHHQEYLLSRKKSCTKHLNHKGNCTECHLNTDETFPPTIGGRCFWETPKAKECSANKLLPFFTFCLNTFDRPCLFPDSALLTPQYVSSLKIWGGNGRLCPSFGVPFSHIHFFSSSRFGSVISISSNSYFFPDRIEITFSWFFFICKGKAAVDFLQRAWQNENWVHLAAKHPVYVRNLVRSLLSQGQ